MLDTLLHLITTNRKYLILVLIAYSLDFISGTTKAIINKNFKSSKFRASVLKGLTYFCYIVISFCCEYIIYIKSAVLIVCVYISLTEFISVIENMQKFGKFPAKLIKQLKAMIFNYDDNENVKTQNITEETEKTEEI